MDVFSVGVVIAELFLEDIIFDHKKLLDYKDGKYNIEPILSKIKDVKLEQLLLSMLTIDPQKRIDINNSLEYFAALICPISFSRMFIHFNTLMINSVYWKPDKRIGLIRNHWKQIWKTIFGKNEDAPELYQHLNHTVLNKFILDNPLVKPSICENYFKLIFNLNSEKDLVLYNESEEERKLGQTQNKESAYILINLILSCFLNTKYSSTKLVALEMLRHLADNLPYDKDLIKIQIIIPYLSKLFKDNSNLIKISALNEVINLLSEINIDNLILPSSDYNFFDAYIFPYIQELYYCNESSVILSFANLLDKITDLEQKFLQISMKSRFYNMKNNPNNQILQPHFFSEYNYLPNNASTGETGMNSFVYGYYANTLNNISKGEEIIQNYDSDLNEFKSTIFRILEDILSKNEDIDIQRIIIRKFSSLMTFTGRRETNNFIKFIISNFNKRDWIIHCEIFKCLPSLVVTLGEKALNNFIVPCMDMIISSNLNEIKIYEMIKSIHILFKISYLEKNSAKDLFKKVLPFILHPNILIRNEVLSFANTLINSYSHAEVYTYLRPELKNFFSIPFLVISSDLMKNSIKERLSRVIYELCIKQIRYILQPNIEDKEAIFLLGHFISMGKAAEKGSEAEKLQLEKQMYKLRNVLAEGISVAAIVKKEFSKSIRYANMNGSEDIKFFEMTFLGKIVSMSSIIDTLQMPQTRNRRNSGNINYILCEKNLNFDQYQRDGIIYQDNFKVKYLLKSLDIVIKDESLSENCKFLFFLFYFLFNLITPNISLLKFFFCKRYNM